MRIFFCKFFFALIILCWGTTSRCIYAATPQLVIQSGHSGAVLGIAFSPDGRLLASGGSDGTIHLWKVQSGETVAVLRAHEGGVQSLAFAPGGTALVSGGADRKVKLWNIQSGVLLRTLSGHKRDVTSVVFSSDGKNIASGSLDATAKLWDAHSGQLKQTLSDPKHRTTWVNSVAFSPNAQQLAVCGAAYQWGTTFVWDLATRKLKYELSAHKAKPRSIEELENNCVAFSPDGKRLVTATRGRVVKMWDAKNGKLLFSFSDKNDGAGSATRLSQVVFSPDGRILAGTSTERTIKLWDAATGKLLRRVDGLESFDEINAVAFSPDGKWVAATNANNIGLANYKTGARWKQLAGNQSYAIKTLAFSKTAKYIASGGEGQPLVLWNVKTVALQRIFRPQGSLRSNTSSLAISPDEQTVAVVAGNSVKLMGIASGQVKRTLFSPSQLYDVTFSPDGKIIAAGASSDAATASGSVRLWNAASGKLLRTLKSTPIQGSEFCSVAFSPDGKWVAGGQGDYGGLVVVWSMADGRLVKTLKTGRSYLTRLAFSSDGKKLLCVSGGDRPSMDVWDLKTSAKERSLPAAIEGAFSPDGKVVAGAAPCNDGKSTVRLWDASSGALLHTLKGHGGFVYAIRFLTGNQIMASGAQDGKIIFWNAKTGKILLTVLTLIQIKSVETPNGPKDTAIFDWIAFTPQGYYTGSKDCDKYIRWRANGGFFPAAKYAAQFRRADVVARALVVNP